MKPYYQDDAVTIYHGDAREILPSLEVDAVVTDPPYGMSLNTDNSRFSGGRALKRGQGPGTGAGRPILGDDEPFDPSFLLGIGQGQIIWGWNHFAGHLPRGACLVWIKRNDAAFGTFLSDAEVAWLSRGQGVWCRRDFSNNAITRERTHPTQKPLALMKWCLGFFPDAGVIADPFMGSGTTLRAAKDLGRKAIGIELEEKYCQVAAERCSQEVLDLGAAA